MTRKRLSETIDAGSAKVMTDKPRDRYDKFAEKLKDLQEQKSRCEAGAIMDVYLKCGKNL